MDQDEQLNIIKVKDGFFLGNEALSQSFEIFAQFKISHIINAAGFDVINMWEKFNIRYLTLNWADSPSQTLFDPKDEIVEKIMSFVDEAIDFGDGVLVHCTDSTNRGCIVVLLYLMRKFLGK